MPISDLFGLNTDAGTAQLQQALQALQAVGVPTAEQLDLPTLQKYVQAGVLTPEQYKAIQADPNAFQTLANGADQSGTSAQKAALQELGGVVQAGGSTPINQANLINNINQTNQAMKAARAGIEENAQERGVAGGGQEFLNKLLNEQGDASNANSNAVNAAANNAQLALQAMTQQGSLGGTLQSQANAQSLAKAEAAQQVAEYNSQLQSDAAKYNTQTSNAAQAANLGEAQRIGDTNTGLTNFKTQYNAQVPQTVFNDQMSKAGAVANEYGNEANLAEQQAASQNQFTGALIGAGATLGGDYMAGAAMAPKPAGGNAYTTNPSVYPGYAANTQNVDPKNPNPGYAKGGMVKPQCYAQGGEVHDHEICMKMGGPVPGQAKVPGDSTQNDTIPAKLSPNEIVLPRSVATDPNAPQKAAQFVSGIKGQPSAPSFSEVIKMLEANGLELRLGSK